MKTNNSDIAPAQEPMSAIRVAEPAGWIDPTPETISARIAIYSAQPRTPAIICVEARGVAEFFKTFAAKIYQVSHEEGGTTPFEVILAVVENLIHANFAGVCASIIRVGGIIKVSDQGPGVADKTKALEPGFTSATNCQKDFIRGVGSGLPTALNFLSPLGGSLTIEDNVAAGTVVTLSSPKQTPAPGNDKEVSSPARAILTNRQKKVLFLILEIGAVGPSRVAGELSVGLSTAYRDLHALEGAGLIKSDNVGRRSLTVFGANCVDEIVNS